MLLNFIKAEKREELLIKKYTELLHSGVKSCEIMVLLQNSNQQKSFINKIYEQFSGKSSEKLQIYSFFSIVYNTLIENWCFVENLINTNKSYIQPNLVGLEVSQFLLKDILKEHNVKGYNSKHSLLHQIFRRYSLIVQNNLTDEEVDKKSEILGEAFGKDAKIILKKLLSQTLKYRSLDYLRQTLIFNYICKNTNYFKCIKYILVDDADELTPVCFDFIKFLRPQLKDWLICLDNMGSSRCGYLSADTSMEYKLELLFNEKVENYSSDDNSFQKQNGDIIFSNILNNTNENLKNFKIISLSKRAEILDNAISKIKELFEQNIKPSDIVIITPIQDEMLKFTLNENLKNCNLKFLSGSEKLSDNPLVKASLNILKLITGIQISEFDLRVILSDYIGIPLKHCKPVLDNYKKNKILPNTKLQEKDYDIKYQNFYTVFNEIKNKDIKISQKVFEIFYKVVTFAKEEQINKFNFFIKQLRDFENVLGKDVVKERLEEIITQMENSIIAENPSSTFEINENDLVIATPQKIIDNKISSKYQLWLDVSSSEWVKTDTGPLYNAWVFQADWQKDTYTIEDDIYLSHQKTARILRKLLLLSKEYIFAYSSLFDNSGVENTGGIENYLKSDLSDITEKTVFQIIPRPDQKPVLDYEKGTMAISAVPGAGKTTILLALIMKLINKGVNPSNIFVLTYMDSAARNFRERIKNMSPDNNQLPNISTIHGLALRIIKENSNHERLGLNADFEICDETQRMRIIKSIEGKFSKNDIEDFDRAISVMKLQEGSVETQTNDKKIEKFKTFYQEYQKKLADSNLIDYDDILLFSVKLLENNKDVLLHYQNICEYIIEDEAQDSSGIQQRLLNLLKGKHNNLVRCGDINQAITTTFSNADTEGFRNFIKTSDKSVEMNFSQRCTQDVMNLANKTVNWGTKILPKAFYPSMMNGIAGKNPVQQNAVLSQNFENINAEKNFVLNEIKNLLTQNPNATTGVLLRNNFQVAAWTKFIEEAGFKTITRSESLGQKKVFGTIFAILKFLQNPFDNNIICNTYSVLSESGFYRPGCQNEIKKSETPFLTKTCDEINRESLSQFLWDMQYWLNSSTLPMEELVIRIGLYYYTSKVEKSNVYLIATLISRLNNTGDFDLTMERLEALSKKPSLSGFKFFSEEEDTSVAQGKIQIMTYHKSKGDEFDYVFIPEFTEKNLSIDTKTMKLKSSTTFMESVRGLNPKYKVKTEQELKEFSAEESLRLFYVAITRAKRKLFITVSDKSKAFGKEVTQEASILFTMLKT